MTLETSIANIRIVNNSIDQGSVYSGSGPVTYNYAFHAWVYGSSNINKNIFMGPSASADMLNIDNCTCIVTENKFIRASTSVNSYIRIYGPEDQVITNNLFDSATTNGTSDILTLGISSLSQYHSNKNQTIYVPISMVGGTFTSDTTNGDIVSDASISVTASFNYLGIFVNTLTPRQFFINFDLNSILPPGVQVLLAKIGVYNVFVGTGALTSGTLTVSLYTDNVVPANFSSGLNSILDVKNHTLLDSTNSSLDLAANLTALQAATQYVTADTSFISNPNNFINTSDKCMTLQVFMANDLSVLGSGLQWFLSALVIKCRWP